MGYFTAMYDWKLNGREDRYDRYANYRLRRYKDDDKEADDWAFEERDYENDEIQCPIGGLGYGNGIYVSGNLLYRWCTYRESVLAGANGDVCGVGDLV